MKTVAVGTLEPGTAFLMPHRPEGYNVGEVTSVGVGSCGVKIPRLPEEEDGEVSGWESTRITLAMQVVPTSRETLNALSLGRTERNRSLADSPVERVHMICEELRQEMKSELKGQHAAGGWHKLRKAAIERCKEAGININTAKTQYYAWKKVQR